MTTANRSSLATTQVRTFVCEHCVANANLDSAVMMNADLIAAAPTLLFELQAAEILIGAMLNHLSLEQKWAVAIALQPYGLFDEGLTRRDARRSAILKATAGMPALRPKPADTSIST